MKLANHFPTKERKAKTIESSSRRGVIGILFLCFASSLIIYNAGMPKRQIGVEVLIEDHFWNDEHGQYVYSFHCPACVQLKLTPELGIYRCDCGSWLIVTNQR